MITKIYATWVYVSDLERSLDFYQNKIEFRFKLKDGDWIEFDLGETVFAILKRPVEKGAVIPQKTRIMFEVDDIEQHKNRLLGIGVKLIGEIRNESYGKLLTFEDPDRHWLELYEEAK
jgi:metallothiol transferase